MTWRPEDDAALIRKEDHTTEEDKKMTPWEEKKALPEKKRTPWEEKDTIMCLAMGYKILSVHACYSFLPVSTSISKPIILYHGFFVLKQRRPEDQKKMQPQEEK